MGGAAVTDNADHLVLYEPGLGTAYPAGSLESADEAVAAGDAEGAVLAVLVGVLEMTKEEVDTMRSSSLWPTRLAIVPTMPRELGAEDDWVYVPGQFDAITAPTLVLAGSESPPVQDDATRKAAAAIPGAQIRVLEGHGHFAVQTAPAMLAAIIRQWISS